MTGDLLHLLSLAVVLNLGIGALISFAEPVRQNLLYTLDTIGDELESVMQSDAYKSGDSLVGPLLTIGSEYLLVRDLYSRLISQHAMIYRSWFKFLVLAVAMFSFLGMIICSAAPHIEVSVSLVIFVACLNIVPMIAAISYGFLSMQMESIIEPKLKILRTMTTQLS